jgi:hypothetical protein
MLVQNLIIVARAEPDRPAISNPCKFVPVAFYRRMHRQTRMTVDLAVEILRATLAETSNGRVDKVPVRLALRCL